MVYDDKKANDKRGPRDGYDTSGAYDDGPKRQDGKAVLAKVPLRREQPSKLEEIEQ